MKYWVPAVRVVLLMMACKASVVHESSSQPATPGSWVKGPAQLASGVDRQNDVGQGRGRRLGLTRRDRVGTRHRRRERVPDAARNAGLAGRQRRIPSCRRKGDVDGGGQMREGSRRRNHDGAGALIVGRDTARRRCGGASGSGRCGRRRWRRWRCHRP